MNKAYKKGTEAVWAGEGDVNVKGAATTPIVNSVAFAYEILKNGTMYQKVISPVIFIAATQIPLLPHWKKRYVCLEGAEAATAFATGMAAISNSLFAFLTAGKKVVSIKDSYGGTSKMFLDFLPKYNIDVELCDTTDHEALEAAIAKGCDVVYLETPTNPTLKVVDIERLSKAAKAVGAIVLVDNTFATPINQNPLQLGRRLVVHSATKFLCGHSDAMGGLLAGKKEAVQKVFQFQGNKRRKLQADPAYMIARGMKTLELRIERQNASALKIAQYLKGHEKDKRCILSRP